MTQGTIAYDIRHWLSDGIQKIVINELNPKMHQTVMWGAEENRYGRGQSGRIGGTVFLTYEDACKAAERMKQQRIKALKNQIEKLEQFTFEDK